MYLVVDNNIVGLSDAFPHLYLQKPFTFLYAQIFGNGVVYR